jgi:hypothetical protein
MSRNRSQKDISIYLRKDHPNQTTNAGIVVNLDIDWMDVPNLEIKLESMRNELSFEPSVEIISEEMDLDVHLANLRAKLPLLHYVRAQRRRRRSTRNPRQIKLYLLSTIRNQDHELLQPPRHRSHILMTTENKINLKINLMIPIRSSQSFERSYDSSASARRLCSTLLG